jgi:hypothetical protein
MSPPVCDAAEYIGVFDGGVSPRRIFIPTDDQIPAKVVASTLVHRAWRLRNIGTCTWGPGYELAFYGGRAMGAGGVAFEFFFPPNPGRRNTVIDENRVIAPEGKPNQISVVELVLKTPSIPGIHQSYWRMRNPQGVYFGPIVGVTMDVVRDCQSEPGGPRIYGAPVINRFQIVGARSGAGETIPYITEVGRTDQLEWSVSNAENIEIVKRSPTGDIQTTILPDSTGRVDFTPNEEGVYEVTLYVDNGSCTITKMLTITVWPTEQERFTLDVALSSTVCAPNGVAGTSDKLALSAAVPGGNIEAEWRHIDESADEFTLIVDTQRRERQWRCMLFDRWICGWEDWDDVSWESFDREEIPVGDNPSGGATINLGGARITLVEANTQYRTLFVMEARKDGALANPPQSNVEEVLCQPAPTSSLPTEIE